MRPGFPRVLTQGCRVQGTRPAVSWLEGAAVWPGGLGSVESRPQCSLGRWRRTRSCAGCPPPGTGRSCWLRARLLVEALGLFAARALSQGSRQVAEGLWHPWAHTLKRWPGTGSSPGSSPARFPLAVCSEAQAHSPAGLRGDRGARPTAAGVWRLLLLAPWRLSQKALGM